MPPIATLLESADRHGVAPPPPPVPESRNYYEEEDDDVTLDAREAQLRDSIVRLQERAGRLERQTQVLREHNRARVDRAARAQAQLDTTSRLSESRSNRSLPRQRSTLPTPPLDTSEPGSGSLLVPEPHIRPGRGSHPLSNSWSPDSPVDGLGDRNRSPTPADGWEIMRATITPDATLPSADSSFTSAAASHSFSSNPDTNTMVPEPVSVSVSSNDSGRNTSDDSNSDSVSSVDPDDFVCDEDNPTLAEAFADHMYETERITPEGRERILAQERIRARDGDRSIASPALDRIDIGFRLIEEAQFTEEGRQRLLRIGILYGPEDSSMFEDVMDARRNPTHPYAQANYPRTRRAHITDSGPPSPQPELYSEDSRNAAREATAQVHDYFRRFTADALQPRSTRSPPPQYEPLGSHPDVNTFTSRDGPQPHPVSPPTQRSEREVADALMSGDDTDLGAMRRVVERLARRDDVPEEWWMSMGLNLSRTQASHPRRSETAAGNRVRAGRIERGNSRL